MTRRARADAEWPRHMKVKRLAGNVPAYYWEAPPGAVRGGYQIRSEALGREYAAARDRALMLNATLDAWRAGGNSPRTLDAGARVGTVDWWLEHYRRSDAFRRLAPRTRADYDEVLARLADLEKIGRAHV